MRGSGVVFLCVVALAACVPLATVSDNKEVTPKLAVGTSVLLKGLTAEKFNGREGTILSDGARPDRYVVQLAEGSKVSVWRSNLVTLAPNGESVDHHAKAVDDKTKTTETDAPKSQNLAVADTKEAKEDTIKVTGEEDIPAAENLDSTSSPTHMVESVNGMDEQQVKDRAVRMDAMKNELRALQKRNEALARAVDARKVKQQPVVAAKTNVPTSKTNPPASNSSHAKVNSKTNPPASNSSHAKVNSKVTHVDTNTKHNKLDSPSAVTEELEALRAEHEALKAAAEAGEELARLRVTNEALKEKVKLAEEIGELKAQAGLPVHVHDASHDEGVEHTGVEHSVGDKQVELAVQGSDEQDGVNMPTSSVPVDARGFEVHEGLDVTLKGLHAENYNGQVGKVSAVDGSELGRIQVTLDGSNELVDVKAENVIVHLTTGTKVVLKDLRAEEYNNKAALVVSPNTVANRVEVQLDKDSNTIAVKPENIMAPNHVSANRLSFAKKMAAGSAEHAKEEGGEVSGGLVPAAPAVDAQPLKAKKAVRHFEPGSHVMFINLNREAFNGRKGVVMASINDGERIEVKLSDSEKRLSVKPENLVQDTDVSIKSLVPEGRVFPDEDVLNQMTEDQLRDALRESLAAKAIFESNKNIRVNLAQNKVEPILHKGAHVVLQNMEDQFFNGKAGVILGSVPNGFAIKLDGKKGRAMDVTKDQVVLFSNDDLAPMPAVSKGAPSPPSTPPTNVALAGLVPSRAPAVPTRAAVTDNVPSQQILPNNMLGNALSALGSFSVASAAPAPAKPHTAEEMRHERQVTKAQKHIELDALMRKHAKAGDPIVLKSSGKSGVLVGPSVDNDDKWVLKLDSGAEVKVAAEHFDLKQQPLFG